MEDTEVEYYEYPISMGEISGMKGLKQIAKSLQKRETLSPEKKEEIKSDTDPFEKILYKTTSYTVEGIWIPALRLALYNDTTGKLYDWVSVIIPYNEETKHLAYTNKECPDKYKNYGK